MPDQVRPARLRAGRTCRTGRLSTVIVERPPLRANREFWLLWVGQASSTLGSQSSVIAMPLLVLSLTGSPAQAGLVGFVGAGSAVVVLLPAGVLADRVDRRALLRWCDAGQAAAMAALALTLALGRPPLVELLGLALATGSLSAFFIAAQSGAIRQVVARADLPAAVARNQAYRQAAVVGGPPLGGLLYAMAWPLPFLTDAVSYLLSYLTITAIRIPLQESRKPPQPREPIRCRLLDGLRWIFGEPFLRASVLYVAALNFVQPTLVLTVIVRASAHGATSTAVGVMFALSGVGGVAGALAAPRIQRRWPPGAVLLTIGAIWATAIPLLTTTTHPIPLGVILAALRFVIPSVNTIVVSYQMGVTPDRLQGQAYASMNLVASSSAPFGSLIGGFLLTAIGSTGALLALTALTITVVVAASASTALRTGGRMSVAVERARHGTVAG
ncbi:MAG: MFS transporter [Pseudonocardiaceae bacterium]